MDRNKLIARLMATFHGELEEHVRTINEGLLALEKAPEGQGRADWFKTLLRVAHSLKGASRSVGVAPIEESCHRLEEVLVAARDGRCALDPATFALLFAVADAIEEAGMRLREQQDLADSPLTRLLPRLEAEVAAISSPSHAPVVPSRPGFPPSATPSSSPSIPIPIPIPFPFPEPTPPAASSLEHASAGDRATPVAGSDVHATIDPERPTLGSAFVRVPAEKLDAMLSRSGELLVARRSVELLADGLTAVRDEVARWRAEWQGAEKALVRIATHEGPAPAVPEACGVLTRAPAVGVERAAIPRHASEAVAGVGDHLCRLERELDRFLNAMGAGARQLERAAVRLDDEVRRVRMLPFAEACHGLERTARDVARAGGKLVELSIAGGDVEIDRSVLEGLRDPLNHLVRNAVDHGLESPEERRAAGKPEVGRVTVAASLRGTQVEVVVADDGRGLDLDAVGDEARRRNLAVSSDASTMADLIFLPGFSTARAVTSFSGRGVGLDVVKSRLESLHGTVDLSSTPGGGTRFALSVPLTLTSLRALLVVSGGRTLAVASACVSTLVRVDPSDLGTIEGRAMLLQPRIGPPIPVVELARVLGLPMPASGSGSETAGRKRPALIVAAGERRVALIVDELVAEQEIIVKSLGTRIRRVRHVSGATILPDGRVAPVLNPTNLVRSSLGRKAAFPVEARADRAAGRDDDDRDAGGPRPVPAPSQAPSPRRLLVVDDSITTRTLEKSILESAGYRVLTAVDGEAAWQLLQEQGADLVVSDIEMPRMDGFALTEAIRRSPRFADLPVVLLTSMASEGDRARGVDVGADAYIVKNTFVQDDLLKAIAQLL